ncbi:PEP/pyruvate-binding domain-containing protein [Nocardia fluminea]|uniref:PEP/pyruvate-binding domain-containing protein n=1 Tax=Nocardia fluminea TaxID=134984 RepID=UPI003421B08C
MTGTEIFATATASRRTDVLVLDGTGAGGDVVGGKAAALDRLIGWGVQVPPAACVTANAYRAVAQQLPVATLLERLGRGDVVGADEVDAAFFRAGLPESLIDEVCAVATRSGEGSSVAVRSSATVEDMDSSSFTRCSGMSCSRPQSPLPLVIWS